MPTAIALLNGKTEPVRARFFLVLRSRTGMCGRCDGGCDCGA
jgi:hypothetical protein